MTEEEIDKKAKEYAAEDLPDRYTEINYIKYEAYKDGFHDGSTYGYEIGVNNERELQVRKKYTEKVEEQLYLKTKEIAKLKAQIYKMKKLQESSDR